MMPLGKIEITRIDLMLVDLRKQWKAADPEDKPYALARIDYWLDQRLALM